MKNLTKTLFAVVPQLPLGSGKERATIGSQEDIMLKTTQELADLVLTAIAMK